MGDPVHLEPALVRLYAQALVAIARANDHLGREVGQRLQDRIGRCEPHVGPLDDLLLAEPLEPDHLSEALRRASGPFRGGGVHPGELARMIVTDGVAVVLAKGYVSEREAQQIVRFATALGCTLPEIGAMSDHLRPWLGLR